MRLHIAALTAIVIGSAAPAAAQDLVRLAVNGAQQAGTRTFKQTLTFKQYFEDGSLTVDRTIPKKVIFDAGGLVRVAGRIYAGVAFSRFNDAGDGSVTASVPNPLRFTQPRTVKGTATGIARRETAVHIQGAWTLPAAGGLEFTLFGGPSVFQTEQGFVTKLNLTVANEVYPYDTLAFPGVTTETVKNNVTGYNAGVDMTWRFAKNLGAGVLFRYSHGQKDFTPTGGQATKVEVGGLHAGGGLRVIF